MRVKHLLMDGIALPATITKNRKDARFKIPAFPGDRLELEVIPDASFGGLTRVLGVIRCEGRELCTARLLLKKGAPVEVAP